MAFLSSSFSTQGQTGLGPFSLEFTVNEKKQSFQRFRLLMQRFC